MFLTFLSLQSMFLYIYIYSSITRAPMGPRKLFFIKKQKNVYIKQKSFSRFINNRTTNEQPYVIVPVPLSIQFHVKFGIQREALHLCQRAKKKDLFQVSLKGELLLCSPSQVQYTHHYSSLIAHKEHFLYPGHVYDTPDIREMDVSSSLKHLPNYLLFFCCH